MARVIVRCKLTGDEIASGKWPLDDMPWSEIRVWQSFATVEIRVVEDA